MKAKFYIALVAGALALPSYSLAQEAAPEKSGQELFEQTCGACHTLALPRSQRLNRANWEWVVDDMDKQFGCSWTTQDERKKIIDYLVEHHGPNS